MKKKLISFLTYIAEIAIVGLIADSFFKEISNWPWFLPLVLLAFLPVRYKGDLFSLVSIFPKINNEGEISSLFGVVSGQAKTSLIVGFGVVITTSYSVNAYSCCGVIFGKGKQVGGLLLNIIIAKAREEIFSGLGIVIGRCIEGEIGVMLGVSLGEARHLGCFVDFDQKTKGSTLFAFGKATKEAKAFFFSIVEVEGKIIWTLFGKKMNFSFF